MRFGNVARYREEVVTGVTVAGLRLPAPPPNDVAFKRCALFHVEQSYYGV